MRSKFSLQGTEYQEKVESQAESQHTMIMSSGLTSVVDPKHLFQIRIQL